MIKLQKKAVKKLELHGYNKGLEGRSWKKKMRSTLEESQQASSDRGKKEDERDDPHSIFKNRVLGGLDRHVICVVDDCRETASCDPSELWPNHQQVPEKKARGCTSDVHEVVDKRHQPECQVDGSEKDDCYKRWSATWIQLPVDQNRRHCCSKQAHKCSRCPDGDTAVNKESR